MFKSTSISDINDLNGTSISLQSIESKLQNVFNTNAKFGKYMRTERIGYAHGFSSVLVRIIADWTTIDEQQNDKRLLPNSFVVKIASTLSMQQSVAAASKRTADMISIDVDVMLHNLEKQLPNIHTTEVEFYKLIRENSLRIKCPKFYFGQTRDENDEQSCLILEDFCDSGFVRDLSDGLSVDGVEQLTLSFEILEQLSILHAHSLKNHSWLENSDLRVSFSKFEGKSHLFSDEIVNLMINENEEIFASLKNDYEMMMNAGRSTTLFSDIHKELEIPPILVHGDLWMSNILWYKSTNNNHTRCEHLATIVDWQIVHPGIMCEDLARLLASSCDANIRRSYLDHFLHYYLRCLHNEIRHEMPMPFTFDQLKCGYERVFVLAGLCVLPLFAAYMYRIIETTNDYDSTNLFVQSRRRQTVLERAKCLIIDMIRMDRKMSQT